MPDKLYFSRDTKVFIEIGSAIWELPVLDGFSFSQATNASEITLNEMASANGTSRRARQMFTDSYAPAEWSFSTYARPFVSVGTTNPVTPGVADTAAKHHAVEEVMWALMVGDASYASNAFTGLTPGTNDLAISFANSNKTTLGTANIYFVLGAANSTSSNTIYKIEGCCVNEAGLDFDIDGIATINWSGFGKIITEEASAPVATITEAVSSTSNFIRNRLTTLSATTLPEDTDFDNSYSLVLTGGSVTISNNLTFLTPETLGVVNTPLGHVTGTRAVSGSFTCYLNAEGTSSAELFEDLIEATERVTNKFGLTFKVGGTASPRIELAMAQCHLEVPTHSLDDVISLETNFHALPSSIDATDEVTIKYVGA
jgi:hypothetical protein